MTQAPTVVSEVIGVIHRLEDDYITVRFSETGVKVKYPRTLFPTSSWVAYGATVKYSVYQKASGVRFQAFSEVVSPPHSSFKKSVEEILKEI